MRLTSYTDYAIRILIYVASRAEDRVTIQEIAAGYGISKNHLSKIVQELHRKGYVQASRGKRGGLFLGRRPEEINIGRLVRDVEKGFALAECQACGGDCVITPACGMQDVLAEALDAFQAVLDSYTLADMLAEPGPCELRDLLGLE
ncbi:Rrf2 family transcriptional regulator [Seongchinamella sediminis]|uniref:Rrf2 family transcriptional regulator n=1 Tax=Seongchinamella sediminis TaxID=2283635 RepID=A0A3L7DXI5_9GAMM|nr:Rrf2 family transcriptional regulator [Seongchinamella sediminis]RLQ20691.1 Rrf2 family transcriptional regulator [Seongchinamella sediminis]